MWWVRELTYPTRRGSLCGCHLEVPTRRILSDELMGVIGVIIRDASTYGLYTYEHQGSETPQGRACRTVKYSLGATVNVRTSLSGASILTTRSPAELLKPMIPIPPLGLRNVAVLTH